MGLRDAKDAMAGATFLFLRGWMEGVMETTAEKLTNQDAIEFIKKAGGQYDPYSNLSLQDQLLACESIVESTPVNPDDWDGRTILNLKEANGRSVSVNGNGSYKRRVNFKLTESKHRAILQLSDFTYQTSPLEIERCLQEIFFEYPSTPGWWLYVAQHWPPRRINWVLNQVLKLQASGRITKHPAACFTYFIRHRKQRKEFMKTNGTRKQQQFSKTFKENHDC